MEKMVSETGILLSGLTGNLRTVGWNSMSLMMIIPLLFDFLYIQPDGYRDYFPDFL